MFQLYALANVLGRAVYSVYPNLKSCSRIRDFLHGIIYPYVHRIVDHTLPPVHIMWSSVSEVSKSESWYFPNHFIPLINKKPSSSKTEGKKEVPEQKSVKRKITSFFTKLSGTSSSVEPLVSSTRQQLNKKLKTRIHKEDLGTTTEPNPTKPITCSSKPKEAEGSSTVTRKLTC